MALRAWRSFAYQESRQELEAKLEELQLFYQDVEGHIRFLRDRPDEQCHTLFADACHGKATAKSFCKRC